MSEPKDDPAPRAIAPMYWRPQFVRRVAPTIEQMVADIQAVAARSDVPRGAMFTMRAYRAGGGRYTTSQFVASIGWKRALKLAGFNLANGPKAIKRVAADEPPQVTAAALAA